VVVATAYRHRVTLEVLPFFLSVTQEDSMIIPQLEKELCEYLHQLPLEQQCNVLELVRALVVAQKRGVPGQALLRFAGAIYASDLATMAQAIEDACEHVHGEDW